ncbi:alpha/beta-hydrolase [Westerdykella ornata]|uniref:Alpha/beta-hydrolase n=1 Tax=Westerdykella ornata TaxID=318751 RepID=A0A6A6JSL7_WESOR|nr:alpha/beta-hydrolase [Westerdykella ornata]KAF2279601.1 alpha/beta-hydrolase [Westerdykella ornata]
MAPTPGILYVTMQPNPSLPHAQFHDWYNNEHGPTRLRLPWCRNGFRYRANDGPDFSAAKPEFMAVYDIEDMEWLTKDVYTRLRKAPVQSQRERDTMKEIVVDRRFYDLVKEWKSEDFKKLEDVENEGEKNVLVAVSVTLYEGEDKEKEVEKWTEQEHVPMLQKVPGWRRTRRFVTSYLDLKDGKAKEFLNLHEYAPENGLGGPEFTAAVSTPWTNEISKSFVKERRRRTYDVYYTFGPAPRDLASLSDPSTKPAESTDGLTRTFPSSPSSNPTYPAIESYITTPDGVRLPYRLEGSPDPNSPLLLCINSILVNYHIWDAFAPAFLTLTNTKYRILRFDTRGRSTLPPSSTSPITLDTLTQDIITLLDALRVKSASLIGVSLGGATALNTALTHPSRISAFIACDTNAVAPPSNPKAWSDRIAIAEKQGAVSSSSSGSGEPIVGDELAELTVRRWFVPQSYDNSELVPRLEAVKKMVETNSLDGFRRSVNALYAYDVRDRMPAFKGKGAFLVGEGDGVLPKTMKEMAKSLGEGGVRLEVVAGAGHLPMVERPEEVARFVKEFLEG